MTKLYQWKFSNKSTSRAVKIKSLFFDYVYVWMEHMFLHKKVSILNVVFFELHILCRSFLQILDHIRFFETCWSNKFIYRVEPCFAAQFIKISELEFSHWGINPENTLDVAAVVNWRRVFDGSNFISQVERRKLHKVTVLLTQIWNAFPFDRTVNESYYIEVLRKKNSQPFDCQSINQ